MSQDGTQQKGPPEEIPAYVVPGMIAVDIDISNSDERRSLLGEAASRARGRIANRTDLASILDGDQDLAERLNRVGDFVQVEGDPQQAAERAREADERVTASPVHRMGFHWHRLYSATRPEEAKGVELPEVAAGDHGRVIAVVDSGLAPPASLPGWIQSSAIVGQIDIEDLSDEEAVSHGTFVTSLLRQIAPTHVVSMAKAATSREPEGDGDHPEPYPTTELHVAGAIDRLIERHKGSCDIEALHLAVGGPTSKGLPPIALQRAIDSFRDEFPAAVIFSAAGNSVEEGQKIYPAAFPYVRGVAAANRAGDQIVWNADGDEVPNPAARSWVDDVAPGLSLVGLSGRGDMPVVSWSGSSFATSVATASHVNGGPVEVRAGTAYWPNRIMRYGDVPGLRYV